MNSFSLACQYAYYRAAEEYIKKGMEDQDRDAQRHLAKAHRLAKEYSTVYDPKLEELAPLTKKQAADLRKYYEVEAHKIEFSEEYDMLKYLKREDQTELAAEIKTHNQKKRDQFQREMEAWKVERAKQNKEGR